MIQLSDDLFIFFIRLAWFILLIPLVYVIYIGDYFVIMMLLFPMIGWPLSGKLFRMESISFDEHSIFIHQKKFKLSEIEKIKINFLSSSYIIVNSKKHYFFSIESELRIGKKVKILKKRIEHQKSEHASQRDTT